MKVEGGEIMLGTDTIVSVIALLLTLCLLVGFAMVLRID
jgi:hypothetical protein